MENVPQVQPLGIFGLDQRQFPGAPPALDRFLAGDGFLDGAVRLTPDEPLDPVPLGEAVVDALPMLPDPAQQIAGANVIQVESPECR